MKKGYFSDKQLAINKNGNEFLPFFSKNTMVIYVTEKTMTYPIAYIRKPKNMPNEIWQDLKDNLQIMYKP